MVSLGNLDEYDLHQKWIIFIITIATTVSMVTAIVYCACLNFLMEKITKAQAKSSAMGSFQSLNKPSVQQNIAVQPKGTSPATSSKTFTVQPGQPKHKPVAKTTTKTKSSGKSDDLGRIQLHIAYFPSRMALEVTVVRAQNLPAMDISGTSDPYCKLMLLPLSEKKIETEMKPKTLNPVWNELIPFAVSKSELSAQTLYVYVLDYDIMNKDDMIGECSVNLHTLSLTKGQTVWRDLKQSHGYAYHLGQILITLCYSTSHERLTVNILKARDLKAMDSNNFSDPYVKIFHVLNGKKLEKRKTKTVMKNLNPVFNESFTFDISISKIHSSHLLIQVMDYDKLSRNDVIGYVLLGEKGQGTEAEHWNDMTEHMQQPIAQWHRLRPKIDLKQISYISY